MKLQYWPGVTGQAGMLRYSYPSQPRLTHYRDQPALHIGGVHGSYQDPENMCYQLIMTDKLIAYDK